MTMKAAKDIQVGDTIFTPGWGDIEEVVAVHTFGGWASCRGCR